MTEYPFNLLLFYVNDNSLPNEYNINNWKVLSVKNDFNDITLVRASIENLPGHACMVPVSSIYDDDQLFFSTNGYLQDNGIEEVVSGLNIRIYTNNFIPLYNNNIDCRYSYRAMTYQSRVSLGENRGNYPKPYYLDFKVNASGVDTIVMSNIVMQLKLIFSSGEITLSTPSITIEAT